MPKKNEQKKTPEMIRKELLASILEVYEEEDDLQMNKEAKNAKGLKDGIYLVKKYEIFWKEQTKRS